MKPHKLLIATNSRAPEMVRNPLLVLVDHGAGPQFLLKADVVKVLRARAPSLADQLEAVGIIDLHLTEAESKALGMAFAAIRRPSTGVVY